MASDSEIQPRTPVTVWLLGIGVAVVVLALAFAAWRGCTPDPLTLAQREAAEKEKEKKKEEEKKKESDPRIERLVLEPGEAANPVQYAKPGHWMVSSQRMRALYLDFIGESRLTVTNGQGVIYPVDRTSFVPESSRPVLLLKGQPKNIDTTFFVPQVDRALQVRVDLEERGFGRGVRTDLPVTRMPSYQYHFVVLANEPSRYGLLKSLDSVVVPWDGESDADDTEDPLHYRVVTLPIAPTVALPDNPLTWSSIAYILWDEVDPQVFTPEQERALIDWLHWGGQLIVSGPDSLDLLKGSFLEPYLPALNGGSRKITAADFSELNTAWTVRSPAGRANPLVQVAPWSGVSLALQPGGRMVESTGELLAERDVGRGRIVVSAMQLAERELVNWKGGFQSWFNACVLRRPNRQYKPGYFGEATLAWADPNLAEQRLDARLVSGVRYLARDVGTDVNYHYVDVPDPNAQFYGQPATTIREERPPENAGGVGAWNDFSATANAAREALVKAAGVEVPGTSFVVLCLAIYLVALVPLNWLVFNAIGRIEWAWIAAPIIALVSTWAVVKQAQLDIGFVRAQTEIGMLELQPDYSRGHLARYTALYTSLSTTYDLEFDTLTAVAMPFPTSDNPDLRGVAQLVCDYQRYDKSKLEGVFVSSNSTNMVHSEQMFALDGGVRLGKSTRGGDQIENRSQFHLKSVAIVRRPTLEEERRGRKNLTGTWIGELLPGQSAPAVFLPIAIEKDAAPFAGERTAEEKLQGVPRLDLEPTFRLALDPTHFEPGEKRLVARIDEVLPGQTITPIASQVRGATMVVAHLEYPTRPTPKPDMNIKADVAAEITNELE
jgi:hypothetical protein